MNGVTSDTGQTDWGKNLAHIAHQAQSGEGLTVDPTSRSLSRSALAFCSYYRGWLAFGGSGHDTQGK